MANGLQSIQALARASAVILLCVCAGCDDPHPSTLLGAAREAKKQGRSTASVYTFLDDDGAEWPLETILQRQSVLLATAARRPAVVHLKDDLIYTWNVLILREILWDVHRAPCEPDVPPELALESEQIAAPLLGGTVGIEGVAVSARVTRRDVTFVPGQTYLLIGRFCGDSVLDLSQGSLDVFLVRPDGALLPYEESLNPFPQSVLALGTVDRVRAHLKSRSAGR